MIPAIRCQNQFPNEFQQSESLCTSRDCFIKKDSKYSSKTLLRTETVFITGTYLSEALILASTNPQYDNRLFIEL